MIGQGAIFVGKAEFKMIFIFVFALQCVYLGIQYFYHLLVFPILLLQHPQHVGILDLGGMLDERIPVLQLILQLQDYFLKLMNFVSVIRHNGCIFGN